MAEWEHKPLSEVCGFQRGLTYAKADEADSPGHTVLRANNIDLTSHELDFDELKFISDSVAVPASKIVRPGSLLVCTASGSKAHLGKVAYIDSDYGYAFGGFMGQITPSKAVEGRYLFYALISPRYKDFIEALSDGVNINNLKFDDLGRFPVPLPPLPEQRRIVAILDEAFEAIATAKANTEKNLQNAREMAATFVAMLFSRKHAGWKEAPIASCFKVKSGDFLPAKKMATDGGIPVYGGNGIAGTHNASNLSGDHVVIGRVGAKCGNVRHVTGDLWLTDNAFYVSEYLHQFDPAFLTLLLATKNLRSTANQAAQPVISYTTIKDVPLSFPGSVGEQRALAARAETLEADVEYLQGISTAKLAALDELKKSLLHQAFTGQLTAKTTDRQLEAVA